MERGQEGRERSYHGDGHFVLGHGFFVVRPTVVVPVCAGEHAV